MLVGANRGGGGGAGGEWRAASKARQAGEDGGVVGKQERNFSLVHSLLCASPSMMMPTVVSSRLEAAIWWLLADFDAFSAELAGMAGWGR